MREATPMRTYLAKVRHRQDAGGGPGPRRPLGIPPLLSFLLFLFSFISSTVAKTPPNFVKRPAQLFSVALLGDCPRRS